MVVVLTSIEHFTAPSDDGFPLIFVRTLGWGKGVAYSHDNSEIGKYICHQISVPSKTFVTRQHLIDYGRIEICFTRIDSETSLMDFSPNLV